MEIRIEYLKEHPYLVKEISQLFYKEWSYLYTGKSLSDIENSISRRLNYDKIPIGIVATRNRQFAGTACLKEHDMSTRKEFSPWLAGVYVKEEFRNLGIGKLLIEKIIEIAKELKVRALYLYTDKAMDYYKNLGWEIISHEKYQSTDVYIMKKDLM